VNEVFVRFGHPGGLDAPMRFRKNYAEFLEGLGLLERLDRLTLL
jgi:hypothetical protein